MRQKARVTVCCHAPGYTFLCNRSDTAGAEMYCGAELRQTQRELQQSKTQQAAMQAELAVLQGLADTIPHSQLNSSPQTELAHR